MIVCKSFLENSWEIGWSLPDYSKLCEVSSGRVMILLYFLGNRLVKVVPDSLLNHLPLRHVWIIELKFWQRHYCASGRLLRQNFSRIISWTMTINFFAPWGCLVQVFCFYSFTLLCHWMAIEDFRGASRRFRFRTHIKHIRILILFELCFKVFNRVERIHAWRITVVRFNFFIFSDDVVRGFVNSVVLLLWTQLLFHVAR